MSRRIKRFNECVVNKAKEKGYPVEQLEGIELTSHKFRHNVAIKLTRAGADPLLVAEFLGHNDLSMAQAYIQEDKNEDTKKGRFVHYQQNHGTGIIRSLYLAVAT